MLFNFQVVVLVFLKLPCGDTLNIYLLQVLVFNPIILLKKKKKNNYQTNMHTQFLFACIYRDNIVLT